MHTVRTARIVSAVADNDNSYFFFDFYYFSQMNFSKITTRSAREYK